MSPAGPQGADILDAGGAPAPAGTGCLRIAELSARIAQGCRGFYGCGQPSAGTIRCGLDSTLTHLATADVRMTTARTSMMLVQMEST